MSISTVVTRGYGTWSTVNQLPTWGYGIGAAAAAVPPSAGWHASEMSRVAVASEFSRVVVAYPETSR